MAKIGLIHCGTSNLTSVLHALKYLSFDAAVLQSPEEISQFTHLILPGVGSFPAGMKRLREKGFVEPLHKAVDAGTPLLGICLGMQLLATTGEEFGPTSGLGIIPGVVSRIRPSSEAFRIPHVGWNTLASRSAAPLWSELSAEATFYFVHSYAFTGLAQEHIAGTTDHGGEFVCAVQDTRQGRRVYGAQFHPEKSQKDGLILLKNFVEKC